MLSISLIVWSTFSLLSFAEIIEISLDISFNEFKFNLEKIYFNKLPGWRCTGIWSSIDSLEAKGGPFQSFIFYDNKSDRTFHINTLVYNPGKNKAAYIRQLEYVAKSIKTSFH